jgi:small subunit ribosomal protein S1
VDGLIHISELDWRHLHHPSDVLAVGDKLEVKVLSVDQERERIELSRKRLLPDPWHEVTGALEPDQIVEGRVTNVVDFGAFVDVGMGVEGLVHNSEMPEGKDTSAGLMPEAAISVRVLSIDGARRRLALSLRDVPRADSSPSVATAPEVVGAGIGA